MRELLGRALDKPHYKVAALLLAFVVWSYVQLEEETEQVVRARVVWELPAGLMSVQPLPRHVELTVRGTGAAVRRAASASVRIPVDLEAAGVGEHRVEFAALHPEGLPEAVEVQACSPSAITFTLDEVGERKVEVRPVLVGEPAAGHIIREVVLDPPVVRVRGPRGVIGDMIEVSTRPIDVAGIASDTAAPAELELPRAVELLDASGVTAHVKVVPEVERRVVAEVPVVVWQRSGWVADPAAVEVTLEGPAVAVAKVQDEEVVAFAHLPDPADRPSYEAPWGPKEGVRLRVLHGGGDAVQVVRVEPARVEVRRR